ncbi:ABC transporter ATP-binding protein [Neorhodopirellula pilleata]|uniref:ABC transporter ATP-binding protein n=1 Tax=Neorhodopirellula pilleata TaxID=2714738 RepID=UPI001E29076F|nr:ATP-binding cassette domain-containing protein [Neorhodopirellula pilleata]
MPESSPNPSATIQLRDATVRFPDGIDAVASVSLEIQPGERMAIVGPSGCGKTTLLRAIAGLQPLTYGTIERDQDESGFGSTSFVFQQPALLPWRRSLGNVMLPLELQNRNKLAGRQQPVDRAGRIEAAMKALGEVELTEAADLLPHQLSGGMRMRVSIARALVNQPNLLLLDEPFAALDDVLRMQLGDLVTRLWTTHGFTMVLVTHNIAEAIELCDRICVMHRGRVSVVLNNPVHTQHDFATKSADLRRMPRFGEFYGTVSDHLREVVRS